MSKWRRPEPVHANKRDRLFRLADGRIATVRTAPNGDLIVQTSDGETQVVRGEWTR